MKYVFLILSLFGAQISFGSELSCNQDLTREPYCISIENAESYCKRLGRDSAILLETKKCYLKFSKVMAADAATSVCLAGFVKSSNTDRSQSNCGKAANAKKTTVTGNR
ncbi:hypothetical protein [Bdellovibrio bacteriovorus]|uniref:hypothetical protein n=1 Tax=Bdellovibrio bacteriovorus TaxID=959 RepID=UPI0005A24A0D|nr:hypothetical protein [Bdellovibrio bacteriovorus]